MTTQLEYEYGDLVRLMDKQSGDAKHERAATSTLDVIWVLYDQVLRIDPGNPTSADRDRFMLSKGHGWDPSESSGHLWGIIQTESSFPESRSHQVHWDTAYPLR